RRHPPTSPLFPYTTLFRSVAAPNAIRRCHELVGRAGSDRVSKTGVLVFLGGLVAMQGDFDQAREVLSQARTTYEELHVAEMLVGDRKSTRLNSSHVKISYA